MSSKTTDHQGMTEARERMIRCGLPEAVIRNFERLFGQILEGHSGVLTEADIEPVLDVETLEQASRRQDILEVGQNALRQLAVLRLNGGLGTTMGLERAKSLLKVKDGLTFNDIIAKQLIALGCSLDTTIPLIHMTSFSTDTDVQESMARYPELLVSGLPVTFQQHKHPKIYSDHLAPACEECDDLNWNPPGHGDLYPALLASGLAEKLLQAGRRYLFVANADNLGATVDPAILGYLITHNAPFLMETAVRTAADAKGGHLARRRENGRLVLRETSQAPTGSDGKVIPEFGDIHRYRHFNTNNIWLDLEVVMRVANEHEGCIPLPLIRNRKTVNPRDPSSRAVIQIESAMGAAIEVFDGAVALSVPRSRFVPVKSNNDLLVLRSDVYELGEDFKLAVTRSRTKPGLPLVDLDRRFFGLLQSFEDRMQVLPSLTDAISFTVKGDVTFDHAVTVHGDVVIIGRDEMPVTVPTEMVDIRQGSYQL